MQLQQLKQGSGILEFWQQSLSHSSPSQHKFNSKNVCCSLLNELSTTILFYSRISKIKRTSKKSASLLLLIH